MKLIIENWRRHLTETIGLDDAPDLSQDPDGFETAKLPIPLEFRYAEEDETIETKEGSVGAQAGDAIMTGTEGEQWPIPAASFAETYDDLGDGTAAKKNIPVFAKEMSEPFQVKVSWSDDLLQGEEGDYLVQYGDNDYGVVGTEIFVKTYEPKALKLPKYNPETRKRFHRQQSQKRDLARHISGRRRRAADREIKK